MESFDKYLGRVFDRRYKINKIIGIGGMAIVFEAQDLVMKRTVAVKMLKDEIANDAQAVKRFVNESKAVAMLSHPNIVSIYDVSVKENLKYIVMERVEGITLKNYMSKRGPLPQNEVIHYTEQILRALEHAHGKGIIHRDIKPQNIMLLKNGRIKVADFGIAKLPNAETVTMTDKAIGTVYYISPEQASGNPIDQRSDLYSLGVMMYEMTTGELPFTADSPVSVALMQVNDTPRRPREIDPKIAPGLEQIILGAMEKDPERRFQTAGQMLRYIQKLSSSPDYVFKPVRPKHETGETALREGEKDGVKKKRQSRTMFPIIFGVTAAFLIVMGISVYYGLSLMLESQRSNSPKTVIIPNLVGAIYDSSLDAQLDRSIYNLTVIEKTSDNYSRGTIMDQEPRGNERRRVIADKQKCNLTITVSKGPETVKLSDYTYMNYLNVEIALRKAGLICDVKKVESPTVDVGYVVKTLPGAGDTVKVGSTVVVYTSIGASYTTVQVPDCIGMTAKKALKALKGSTGELQFQIGKCEYEYSNLYKEGEIVHQSKTPYSTVPKGTVISFVFSLGPEKIDPPETDPPETDPPDTDSPDTDSPDTDPPDEGSEETTDAETAQPE